MTYSQYPLSNYQFVSIAVLATSARYYFPDLPNLRNVKVQSIVSYPLSVITKDINAVPNLNLADSSNAFLTINADNMERIQKLDLNLFNPISANINFANVNGNMNLDNLQIDFSKSYVEFAANYVVTTLTPFSFCFGVYYTHIN